MGLEVVSFADFFGNNPLVDDRSAEVVGALATNGAENLATALRVLMSPDDPLITPKLVDAIGYREYIRLINELSEKREAGLLNDTQTSSEDIALRGVKMVVVSRMNPHREAERIAYKFGGDHPAVFSITAFEEADYMPLLGISFDNARFREIEIVTTDLRKQGELNHNISVYGYLDNEAFDLAQTVPMHFFLPEVVRLETVGGNLWQNPNCTQAGLAIAQARV